MKYFLLIIASFFLLRESHGQLVLNGIVTDFDSNEPLVGANVYSKTLWTQGTITNAEGKFILALPDELHNDTLIISFIGYREKLLLIKNQEPNILNVKLDRISHEIEEATVVARKVISEEFTIKEMKKMDIYLDASAKADPLLAVGTMASSTTTDESANISLRGSTPAETGIFFNNVPVYDAVRFSQLNGIGTFSIFNTAIVERISVFPGNPPLEYGNSTSGVVAIQSDEIVPDEAINSLSLSLANLGVITSRKIAPKTGLTAYGNYQPSAGLIVVNPVALDDLKDFTTYDAGIHLFHHFANDWTLKTFNYTNVEGFTYRYRHPSFDGDYLQEKKRNFTITNLRKNFTKGELAFDHGMNFSKAKYAFSIMDAEVLNKDFYLASSYLYYNDKFSWKNGLTFTHRTSDFNGKFPVLEYAMRENHPSFTTDTIQKLVTPEVYSYFKYNLTQHLVIGGGLRTNLPNSNQENALAKQLNLNFSPNQKHSITLSAGSYYNFILLQDQFLQNNLIKSNQYSIDYHLKQSDLELSSSLFHKQSIYNEIESKSTGFELFVRYNQAEKIEVTTSFTWIDVNSKNGESEIKSPYDIEYFTRASFKYFFYTNWEISAVCIFRQGTWYKPIQQANYIPSFAVYQPVYSSDYKRLPNYSKLDVSLNRYWPVSENLVIILYASANNIFNHDNVREINYNIDYSEPFEELFSQRTYYFGTVINF